MQTYEELYHLMFNAATDAKQKLDECNYGTAKDILIDAQRLAEELYISSSDSKFSVKACASK